MTRAPVPAPPSPPARDDRGAPRQAEIPAAEWAVAALGVALLAGALVVLGRAAIAGSDRPAEVTVAVDTVVAGRGGWLVRFRAENAGDATAADLTVRGVVAGAAGDSVVREARVDYLPGRSTRRGGLFFPGDPRGGLRLEALGYRDP